ncbi:hypothetical protein SeLEV6574_g08435, partial [Synchytrium endobioticum]
MPPNTTFFNRDLLNRVKCRVCLQSFVSTLDALFTSDDEKREAESVLYSDWKDTSKWKMIYSAEKRKIFNIQGRNNGPRYANQDGGPVNAQRTGAQQRDGNLQAPAAQQRG